jgi:hypothetical protein
MEYAEVYFENHNYEEDAYRFEEDEEDGEF